MDEKRFNEIDLAVERRINGYTAYNAANPWYGVASGMDVDETYGFLNKQAAYDDDWKIAKGFYNGLVANTGRGIMGALALIRDWNIDTLKERGLAYNENTVFEDIANSDVLTPYDIKGRNELEQLGIDFASGAGQLVGQAATTALTGGAGGMAAMGTQIAGNQYLNLRQQGVSAENARFPSIANALMQAPLERFGLEGILAKVPAKSVLREKAKRIAQAAITEGVTEWLQQYPEEITNLYALQPGDKDDPQQRRKAWSAAGDEFIKNFGDITREGAYAGLIGAMLGGGGAGINVMFGGVDRRIRKQVHNELLQDQAKRIEDVKKSGVNPDYARNVINANTQGDKVYVDGGVLHQYMQQGNATEIAKNIGVPEAEVAKAAEEGLEVAINQGDFVAAAAKMPNFFQTIQNDVAFEEGGYTLTKAQLEEEQQKLAREIQREDPVFREQMDSFRTQLQKAGVNREETNGLITLMESRARAAYPDEPSRFFIEHPLEIQRVVRPQNGKKYFQIKSASERLLEDERNFGKLVDDFFAGKTNNTATYNVMTTPLALKLAGGRVLPVTIDGSKLEHIFKEHSDGITAELLKQVPRAMADPMMILNSYAGRKVVVLDLKDKNGATIIVPMELEAKKGSKQYVVNAINNTYGKGDKKGTNYEWFIEHNINKGRVVYVNRKKTAEWLQSPGGDSTGRGEALNNLSNNSIPDENDLRNELEANEGYYQKESIKTNKGLVAYHNTNEKALMAALETGGLAVPSIAITNRDFDYDNFGNITLIGTRDLVDPANNTDVYSRDAYTTRTPRTEYKKMKSADVRAFVKKWGPEFEKIDARAFAELEYHLDNGNMRSAYNTFIDSRALKYYYLTRVKDRSIELPRENLLKSDIFKDEQFTRELREIIENRANYTDEELHNTITEKAKAAAQRLWKKDPEAREAMIEVYSDSDEHYNLMYELRSDLSNKEKPVDVYALDKIFDNKYRAELSSDDYVRWAKKRFEQYAGEPQLKIGSKYYPYNLENLVKAMLKSKGRGKEDTLTYSSAVVAANTSRKFKSIDEIRKYADQLAKSEDVEKQINDINALAGEYQRLVAQYYKYGASSFDVFDDSMKALSKSMTVNADSTAPKLNRALESLGFENVPDDIVKTGVKVANALKHAVTQYFEAKPQRAVGINEFAAAVVPTGTNPELIKRLREAGLQVEVYDKNVPGARRAATQRAQNAGTNILFQLNYNAAHTATDLTQTQAFKDWFGDSVITDENDEPLAVYHATDADFKTFSKKKLGSFTRGNTWDNAVVRSAKIGFWFNENDLSNKIGTPPDKTKKVYLKIENPYHTSTDEIIEELRNQTADDYVADMIYRGYDGLIVGDREFNSISYVVFDNKQIKAADNRGTFNPNTANIYNQSAGMNARTANWFMLDEAARMRREGKLQQEIYEKTGWRLGKDGRWRFDIPDNLDKINLDKLKPNSSVTLGEIYDNEKLYAAYPKLRSVKISKTELPDGTNGAAVGQDEIIINNKRDDKGTKATLIHEVQHIIQGIEGFASGGDPIYTTAIMREAILKKEAAAVSINKQAEEYYHARRIYEEAMIEGDADRMANIKPDLEKYEKEIPDKAQRDKIYKLLSEAYSLYRKHEKYDSWQAYQNLYGEKEARNASYLAELNTEIERRRALDRPAKEILKDYIDRLPEELKSDAERYAALFEIEKPTEAEAAEANAIEERLDKNEVGSQFVWALNDAFIASTDNIRSIAAYNSGIFNAERGDAIVLFNNNLVASYSMEHPEAKGSITWDQEGNYIIQLFQSADASTLIHEVGHYFVDALARDVNNGKATPQQRRDWEKLLNYAGITNEQWLMMSTAQKTPAHEKFARAFEQYLMEGKAPSHELRGVFRRFKNWLLNVYKSVEAFIKNNPDAAPLTDDVRQVFGRMLAAEEDIQTARRVDGYFNDLPAVVMDNLPESWQRRIDDFTSKAKDKAIEILTQKSLANFTQERRERIEAYRTEILPQAQEDIEKMPLYNAADDIEAYIGDGGRTAKNSARKYLNANGRRYANWREEWEAVRADIDERLNPIIEQLESGMKQGVSKRYDEATGRWLRESNNDMWYREWWRTHKRQPTQRELRDMAYEIYVGDRNAPGWINDSAEAGEYFAQNKAEIDELLAREQDLLEFKDDVAKYRYSGLPESDRLTFDMLAEKYGYSCGDELAQKIIEAPSKQSAITARVDEYVQQAFPDIYKERELAADAVRESLYNDESGAVIGLEQQLIQDYIDEAQVKNRSAEANRRIALARKQQALVAAQTEINKMPVEDAVRTSRFISAERLAAQRAAEAMALGAAEQKKAREAQDDGARSEAQANATAFFQQALRYKNQQAFNHAMVSESMKMRTAVTKYRNYINRQFTANRKTWRTEQHFAQAAAILARMGFVRKDYDPYLKKQKLEQYSAEMEELYGTGSIAGWIMDENNSLRRPMQMTFKQFEDIVNALKNIKANAKAEEGKGTLGVNATFEELLYDIMQHLDKIETKFLPKAGKRLQATPFARMKASARSIDNLFEWMDGWSYGFFSKVFGGEIKHCNDREAELTMAWKERVVAAQKEWLPDAAAKREAERRFYSKELGCEVDRYVLVRLLMNLGNEGNARVLCSCPPNAMRGSELWVYPEGNKTYEQAVMETKANLLTYLGENLTIADVQYAQDMIDAANMYWNEFSALEQRTKGFAPKKVEALPVDITLADGTEVTFKGGYFPLIRDGEFGNKPQGRDVIVSDTEPNQGRNIRTLATGNGNLKERVNASYPIDLTRGAEFYVMQNGIHDLCWRETLTGFRRILNDESMYAMLKEKLGPAQMKVFREMLEKAAQPFNAPGSSEGENLLNDAAGWLRRKTVAVAIMGNIKTMLQNGGNILLYGRSVEGFGYSDALAAMANWGKNWSSGDGEKGLRAFVTSKSVFMRERTENPDITLREIKDEDNLNPIEKKAMEWGSKAMAYTDNFTAMPVWAQAYMKKINDGAKEQEAVDFADMVIRRTLGSSRLTDVSSLQRGGNLAKLFMMFQGFFNTQYNQWERQYGMAKNKWKAGERLEAMQNICAFACGKWFAVCLLNLLLAIENPFEDDDDEYMKVTKELMHYPISLLGPVGTVGNAVLDNAMGFNGYGYRMTAAESAINNVIRVAGKVNKVATEDDAELTDLVEPAATVGGYIVGAPGVINKLFFNAWDILYNDMEPEWGDLLKRRPARER